MMNGALGALVRLVIFAAAVSMVAAIVAASAGAATVKQGGWAGSRYAHGDCRLMLDPGAGKPSLYCETTFTERADVEFVAVVADETCASGALLVQVVGTTETVWRVWDLYAGPAPLGKFSVAGNEAPLSETWLSRTATELDCA